MLVGGSPTRRASEDGIVALVENRGVLFPHAGAQRGADVERSDLEARVVAAAGHERHRAVAGPQRRLDRLHRAGDHPLGPQLALLGVLDAGLDLLNGLTDAHQPKLCILQRIDDRLGERSGQALSGER